MMDTPGTVLRSERERQQKTLKDISRKLKINLKYLEAIEDDDYALLPAEVFARSYIRLYADELELDSAKLLALFENMGKPPAVEEVQPQEPPEPVPAPAGEGTGKSLKPLLVAAAAGLMLLIIMLLSQKKEQTPERAVPAERNASKVREQPAPDSVMQVEKAPAPEKSARHDAEKPAAATNRDNKEERVMEKPPEPQTAVPAPVQPAATDDERPAEPVAAPLPVSASPRDEISLRIIATELTWVSLSIDGATPKEWQLRPGQVVTVTGRKGFQGKIGNAGGTKVFFNNQDLGELGPPGKIVEITLPR